MDILHLKSLFKLYCFGYIHININVTKILCTNVLFYVLFFITNEQITKIVFGQYYACLKNYK